MKKERKKIRVDTQTIVQHSTTLCMLEKDASMFDFYKKEYHLRRIWLWRRIVKPNTTKVIKV